MPPLFNYFEMYDTQRLKDGLMGLIGWRQNYDPTGVQLEADLIASSSGNLFNDEHPLLTFDNLYSIAPDFDRVYDGDAEIATAFNQWLREETEGALIKAIDDWKNMRASVKTAKNLIERKQLFSATGRIGRLDALSDQIAGMEVRVERSRSTVATISHIGLRFNKAHDRTLYLFKSDKVAPVKTLIVNYTTANEQQWFEAGWELEGEGAYYICYDQDEVADVQSLNGVDDHTWENNGFQYYPSGRYILATSFRVDIDNLALWDVSKNVYSLSTNYGINLRYSVKCDFTDFVLDQSEYFKTLIAQRVAMHFLRILAFNAQSQENRHVANIDPRRVLYEIDGDSQGRKGGIGKSYKETLNSMTVDVLEGVDKICLPCQKKGVDYSST